MTTTTDPNDMKALLLEAFDKHSVNAELRAGIAALCGGESSFKPVAEVSYAHTDVSRIRSIFKTATAGLTDAYINQIKGNPEAFFNLVYGHNAAPSLGNTQEGDGYKYRGRGLIQLTGRANYTRYAKMLDVDLVNDPDRENEPAIAVETAVVYMLDRYKGGGWQAMKDAVGNSFGNVDERKNQLFAQYTKTGEWNAPAPASTSSTASDAGGQVEQTPSGASPSTPAVAMEPVEGLRRIQRIMIACGFYVDDKGAPRKVDGDFRTNSVAGLDGLVRAAGQPSIFTYKA